jgi:hypothetical protein
VLLIGGRSVAPNSFALGIGARRDAIVIHQLVAGQAGQTGEAAR